MKVTLLGSGASGGVPLIGPEWGACDRHNRKNHRRRSSLLLESATTTILIDATPDLRMQLIDANIRRIDAVLLTHTHADHINGIDDLRVVNNHTAKTIDLYASAPDLDAMRQRFPYLFTLPTQDKHGRFFKPGLIPHELTYGLPITIGDVTLVPFCQDHGVCLTTGFRCGAMAYSPDVVRLPAESLALLGDLSLWIVDCLRVEKSPTHANLEQVIEWTQQLKPKRVVLTHMSHESDYDQLCKLAPKPIEPAWDGMVIHV
ncbi:MAG: MBL fold metallo-hydrolase [Alphaproteobacteria bacterium GM202ARS2]|nr:MBL fold metallo-hydrolase [Alphaproteobacteria bacterium GM202ARS2]